MPDGIYSAVSDTILEFSRGTAETEQWIAFADALRHTVATKSEIGVLVSRVDRDAPALRGLVDLIPKSNPDFYSVIAILVGVIGILVNLSLQRRNCRTL